MLSHTNQSLEKFDNQHDFERMSADILNALGYTNVTPIAPKGGSDGGKDIEYKLPDGSNGLACVSLRKDVKTKFLEDLAKRFNNDYEEYTIFTNQYLTANDKRDIAKYCLNNLHAQCVFRDLESIRSLLDAALRDIRKQYLNIEADEMANYSISVFDLVKYSAPKTILQDIDDEISHIKNQNDNSGWNFVSPLCPSKEEVIRDLKLYKNEWVDLINLSKLVTSFNLHIESDTKDSDVEISVRDAKDKSFFTFENGLEAPRRLTGTYPRYQLPSLAHISPAIKDNYEFYADVSDDEKEVTSSLKSLNANKLKSVFDSTLYVISPDEKATKKLSIKITIHSTKLKQGLEKNMVIDFTNAKVVNISANMED